MKDALIGNEPLKTALFRKIKENIFCASYIVEGDRGTGKLTAARLAAAAMCCSQRQSDGMPCGECGSCKKILSGGHVDVTEVYPESGKAFISIAQIREIREQSMLIPSEADYRIFIIRNGDLMNANGQNALLKTLEEPGEHLIFFILTTDTSKLLPTVLSRSVRLHTERLTEEMIKNVLRKRMPTAEEELIDRSARLSAGSLGKAIELAENGGKTPSVQLVTDYFTAIANGAHHAGLCTILSPAAVKRDALREILSLMTAALRDIMLFSENADAKPLFFVDMDLLKNSACRLGATRAARIFDKLSAFSVLNEGNISTFEIASFVNIEFS